MTLQNGWAPIRLLQAPCAGVFEKFVHWCEQDTGSLHVQPHIEIELVIQKMDIAMTQHAKKRAVCLEIVRMDSPLINLEVRCRSVRDAISAAGNNPIQDS